MGTFEDMSERQVSVTSGSPAILNLPPIESVPSPSVTWQSDEGPLNYDIKYVTSTKNQLIILSANEDDQRSYRARATNTQLGEEENSPYIRLNVTGDPDKEIEPEIIVHPESMRLLRGDQMAELQCVANARSLHDLETIWMKDGLPIENAGILYTFNDIWNRTLALLSLNLTHSGQYTCQVRMRSGGFETVTSTASVIVQETPSFFTPLRTETLGDYASTMSLPCDVIGEPSPHVTWFRNADAIDLSTDRYALYLNCHLIASNSSSFEFF